MGTLIEDLERPESYPPPRPASVARLTTHGSWVFLTDTEAWKIKRPVDYGFMDFTTLDKRRHFCAEEVRLNRRLAADVYLGVEPVRRDGQGHSLARGGEVVDYAVRMRRLPDEASALAMARAGLLGHAHLETLARRLVRFYAEAAPAPEYGSPSTVRANIRQNFSQVEPFVGRYVDAATFRAVRAWQEGLLSSRAGIFEARAAAGRIRDGHGDLRLEHVYFEGAEALIIDCIDFNPALRCCDAASDAAFLAMDLDHENRPDLAAFFLARFAQQSNDYDLYTVVDLYLGYRAWVRGKVACLVAADPSTPGPKVLRKAEEARTHFALALAYTRPCFEPPWVLAIGGNIGSGKSTLADALARGIGFPVISSDATRKHLAGVDPAEPGGDDLYTPEFSRRTFAEFFRRAHVVLDSGRGVILDATFRSSALRLRARELARRHGRPFLFIETRCDESTIRERLRRRARGPSVSDAGEDLLERLGREFEPVSEIGPAEHAIVDTRRPVEELAQRIRARVRGD